MYCTGSIARASCAQQSPARPQRRRYGHVTAGREIQNCGAEARDRTEDTGIFSAVLYQLSYLSNPSILGLWGVLVNL